MIMNKKAENLNFGENLRRVREKRGYTQVQLSEMSGISRRMIGHYETQVKRPSVDKVKKLADALSTSVDELMGVSKSVKKSTDDPSYRIMKRVRAIEKLPKRDQEMVFHVISTLVEKNKLKGKS